MASGLIMLLDDVAAIAKLAAASLDDVAAATAKAGAKSAGVVIDDAAVTPTYVTGFTPDRELPIIWKIAKGSLRNKLLFLTPVFIALAAFLPQALTPLLMLGGAFLCYEGVEKIAHKLFAHDEEEVKHDRLLHALADDDTDMLAFEKDKIKGAIRTDFILSAEIIVISLGTVASAPFAKQLSVLVAIALIMTVGVYGLVGGIVKLDDLGLRLTRAGAGGASMALGRAILAFAPKLMRFLSVAGTAAMFLVGGGILVHDIPLLHHWAQAAHALPPGWLWENLFNAACGVVAGALVLGAVKAVAGLRGRGSPAAG